MYGTSIMTSTFINPVPQFAPQNIDPYRHTQPNPLFPKQLNASESTFGNRKKKGRSISQKFRSELIRQSKEMNDMVMSSEESIRSLNRWRTFRPGPDPDAESVTTKPESTRRDDDSMLEEGQSGRLLTGSVDEMDMGMGGINVNTSEIGSIAEGEGRRIISIDHGLVDQKNPGPLREYKGKAVGTRGKPQSVVSDKGVIDKTMSTKRERPPSTLSGATVPMQIDKEVKVKQPRKKKTVTDDMVAELDNISASRSSI